MDALRTWLRALGLERYAKVFAENEVDLDALRLFDERDFETLGVPLGPRRKLLKAIAELNGAHASARPSQGVPDQPATAGAPAAEAERRQLTVMFCDLVDSTQLATRLDPEELRDLMQAYQRACGEVIARYEGHVAQYLGDGLMIYFGWPRAHEDDAARAIRAGLEVAQAVSQLKSCTRISARVGIHTGLVVVGETGQGDASIPKAAVGETPNIASRLQNLAQPGSVVVSERTRGLAGGLFDYVDLGAPALKGVAEALHVFGVVGPRAVESRFDATRTESILTPLVGREEELALLLRRWQEAREGEGQVVLVGGEPGIGKSRITRALRERLDPATYMPLRYQCSPYHVNSALYPVIEQFERAAGFRREDTTDHKLDKLQAVLVGSEAEVMEAAPLFAAMLSLPLDRYSPLKLSSEKQKEATLEALASQIETLARRQPLLMIWEDVHWVDATSQEALDLLMPRLQGLPVLLIVTHRPEYSPRWSEQPHVTALGLGRLGKRKGAEMVARLVSGKTLPQDVLEQIVARTDGVPLFVEELTKSILESKLLREQGSDYVLESPLPPLAIPTTLRDLLIARLDRLAPIREVAQIGACIGREFSHELLAAVSRFEPARLEDALQQLTTTGLLFRRGSSPDTVYTFKHALVQDAAYDSLLKSKRRELHANIARVLADRFPRLCETEPETLGLHFERAGFPEEAIGWYIRSGQQARKRSANYEAIQSFQHALSLLGHMKDPVKAKSTEVGLRSSLGMLHMTLEGFASRSARTHLARAHELGVNATYDERFPAMVPLLEILSWDSSKAEARSLGDELLQLATASGARIHSLYAHQARGRNHMYMGRFRDALAESLRAMELYSEQLDVSLATEYGYDPGVFSLSSIAYCYLILGYPDRAEHFTDECIALARRVGQPYTLSFALAIPGADIWYLMRNPEKALRFAREGQKVSAKWGFGYLKAMCDVHAGWATAMRGDYVDGLECMTQALDAIRDMGVWATVTPRMFAQLASVYAGAGRADEGLRVLDSSPDRQSGRKRVRNIEISRIEGDLHRLKSNPDLALTEACYREAVQIAVEEEAKSFELRSAISLARLWSAQGKTDQALGLLAPLVAWFTEGDNFADLQEARALLDTLQAPDPVRLK